jgi:cytochrome c6
MHSKAVKLNDHGSRRKTNMRKFQTRILSMAIGLSLAAIGLASLPAHAQNAESTYKSKCAMCHGADGKGQTPAGKAMGAHDFASPEVQKMTEEELAAIISKGKGKMPAYGSRLKESEIKDLAAYVHQLSKGK